MPAIKAKGQRMTPAEGTGRETPPTVLQGRPQHAAPMAATNLKERGVKAMMLSACLPMTVKPEASKLGLRQSAFEIARMSTKAQSQEGRRINRCVALTPFVMFQGQ